MRKDDTRHKDIAPRSSGTLYERRARQDWESDGEFRILSIDGGGIRGILPLAAMARLEEKYLQGGSIADYFDLVAGTSTGGIIALGFARGLTASQILSIYINRGGEVFPNYNPISKWLRGKAQLISNRCDTDALYELIDEVVGKQQLWQSSKRLCIPAAETRHFEPYIYKTPHHLDYRKDWSIAMSDVAKSTSAAPAHFKPFAAHSGFEFIDGGVWANNPIMIAVSDALACFDIRREQIKVLSMGCGETRYEMTWGRRYLGGLLTWTSLMFEAMQIQSQNVVGQARLIAGGDRILRIESKSSHKPIDLWDWSRAKDELPKLGEELIDGLGNLPSNSFFQKKAKYYSPLYGSAQ